MHNIKWMLKKLVTVRMVCWEWVERLKLLMCYRKWHRIVRVWRRSEHININVAYLILPEDDLPNRPVSSICMKFIYSIILTVWTHLILLNHTYSNVYSAWAIMNLERNYVFFFFQTWIDGHRHVCFYIIHFKVGLINTGPPGSTTSMSLLLPLILSQL